MGSRLSSAWQSLIAAAHSGRLKTMRTLLEDYHTYLNVKGLGTRKEIQQVADYLEKRMSGSKPGEVVDLSSEVNENNS